VQADAPANISQKLSVTARATAEPVVEADNDLPGLEAIQESIPHEIFGLNRGKLTREWHDHRGVETDLGD
jgi:hypothetical protein